MAESLTLAISFLKQGGSLPALVGSSLLMMLWDGLFDLAACNVVPAVRFQ